MPSPASPQLAEAVEAIGREYRGYKESETDGSSEDTLDDWMQALADATLTHWPVIKAYFEAQLDPDA